MVAATAISTTATRKACLLFRYPSVSVMLTDNSIISVGESDNRIEQSYNHYCSAILSLQRTVSHVTVILLQS